MKKITEMSLDELKKKESTLQKANPILLGLIIVMAGAGTFLTIKNGFGVFTVLPVIFLASYFANAAQLKNIREEISKRPE